jgi:short-subunit dehydrogenase
MPASNTRPLAVVTGASDGIGYELAKQFADNGYDLLVCAEDGGIVEAGQAFGGSGAQVETAQIDLASLEGVRALYDRIQALGRPVEAIAINAGIGVYGDFARETKLEDELRMIDLNVISSVHLAKLVLHDMVARNAGKVLITSSVVAVIPATFDAVYGATKAFLYSFSEALRDELKDTEITITCLMPGATETNFFHRAGMDDTKVGQAKKDDPALVAKQGFEALMGGKDKVVGGSLKNKAQVAAARILPDQVTSRMHRKMAEPADKK